MRLFIKMLNGQPHEHPIVEDNFKQAFPNVDLDNLPQEFANFERVSPPKAGTYEVVEGPTYELIGGVVKDVWRIRQMSEAEKQEKNALLTKHIYATRDTLKTIGEEALAQAKTEVLKQAWADYLNALDAWVLVDPAKPGFPLFPRIDENGNLLTISSPGSAPDVAG